MVSETIFSGYRIVIPMADVQHIERLKDGHLWVITSKTRWDMEADTWANVIYLDKVEAPGFMKAWCHYRAELDGMVRPTESEEPKDG